MRKSFVEGETFGTARTVKEFLSDVADEIERARKKFPLSDCCVVALTEEVGELAQACLSKSAEEIYKEAVQVAAMAARVTLEGDSTLWLYRSKVGAGRPQT